MKDYKLKFYPNHPEHHQGILIFTENYNKAKHIADWYIKEYEFNESMINENRIVIELTDGRRVIWVHTMTEGSLRGYRCSEAYVDMDISKDLWLNRIRYTTMFCSPETIRMI